MVLIFGIILALAALAAGRLVFTAVRWGVRWEMRMVRLAVHAALFGAGAMLACLIWLGWIRI